MTILAVIGRKLQFSLLFLARYLAGATYPIDPILKISYN